MDGSFIAGKMPISIHTMILLLIIILALTHDKTLVLKTSARCITQLAKMSIDPEFVEVSQLTYLCLEYN